MVVLLLVGCLDETPPPIEGDGTVYGETECRYLPECEDAWTCCDGDGVGDDVTYSRCWVHSPAGVWDCAAPGDCAEAEAIAVLATCPLTSEGRVPVTLGAPGETGDTGL